MIECGSAAANVAAVERSLLLFYLTIGCNFLAPLFGCGLQRVLGQGQVARHCLGFVTLLVFTDVAGATGHQGRRNWRLLLPVAALYGVFVASSRMRVGWGLAFLGAVVAVVLLAEEAGAPTADAVDAEERSARRQRAALRCVVRATAAVLLVVGVGLHLGDKRRQYNENFRWSTFWLGVPRCP